MNEMQDRLWNLPHVQAYLKMQQADEEERGHFLGYNDMGLATWHFQRDDLLATWSTHPWQITLAGLTYQGTFETLEEGIEYLYYDCLGREEFFSALSITVSLEVRPFFRGLPIEEANIETVDERGWRVSLSFSDRALSPDQNAGRHQYELLITAHPAAFTPCRREEEEKETR